MKLNFPSWFEMATCSIPLSARLRRRTVAFGSGTELASTAVPLISMPAPFFTDVPTVVGAPGEPDRVGPPPVKTARGEQREKADCDRQLPHHARTSVCHSVSRRFDFCNRTAVILSRNFE